MTFWGDLLGEDFPGLRGRIFRGPMSLTIGAAGVEYRTHVRGLAIGVLADDARAFAPTRFV